MFLHLRICICTCLRKEKLETQKVLAFAGAFLYALIPRKYDPLNKMHLADLSEMLKVQKVQLVQMIEFLKR